MKEKRLAELLAKADGHPMMKTIHAEEAAAILGKRKETVAKIEGLKKEREEVIPRLRADIEAKEDAYVKAKAALNVASGELQRAKAALSSEGYQFDSAICQHESVLYETASAEIDKAIEFFQDKFAWLREPNRISSDKMGSERNLFTEKKKIKVRSNINAINSALHYCMDAVKKLERMKLEPALDLEKIETMKKEIPDIGVYTESTAERALPKGPSGYIWRSEYEDELTGRLMEKVDKYLATPPPKKK